MRGKDATRKPPLTSPPTKADRGKRENILFTYKFLQHKL
jgi:hypothetical protein